MFALPSLGGNVSVAPADLTIDTVIDVQVVPSHKKTFTLSSSKPGWEERPRVEIPLVAAPPLARNVPASVAPSKGRTRTSSPRMKRIKREDYIAALKSLPPLPKVQSEPQGLAMTLPQAPQIPVMLPNQTFAFQDIPQEEFDPDLEDELEALALDEIQELDEEEY